MRVYPFQQLLIGITYVGITFVSFVCSGLSVYLIYDMSIWNGSTLLIYSLSLCQFLYDFSLFLVPCAPMTAVCGVSSVFLTSFFGFATSMWSNFIMYSIFQTVYNFNRNSQITFDIKLNFKLIASFTMIISLLSGVIGVVADSYGTYSPINNGFNAIYAYVRLALVFINVIIYICMLQQLFYIRKDEIPNLTNNTAETIHLIVKRMIYYPIIQAITRGGMTWYQVAYSPTDIDYTTGSMTKYISLWLYAICTSITGLLYFLVFIIMQPNAYKHLKKIFSTTRQRRIIPVREIPVAIRGNLKAVEKLRSSNFVISNFFSHNYYQSVAAILPIFGEQFNQSIMFSSNVEEVINFGNEI